MRDRMAFPPRYAGMEGASRAGSPPISGFPRATRGWKDKMIIFDSKGDVSPALRGDGSPALPNKEDALWFPPRYAGMEESHSCSLSSGFRFPRATRGRKATAFAEYLIALVSPALRGDGRVTASKISATTKFPPRYAGMEVNRVGRIGFEFRFPRATRGWKDLRRV